MLVVYFSVVPMIGNFLNSCNVGVAALLQVAKLCVAIRSGFATCMLQSRGKLQRVATKLQFLFGSVATVVAAAVKDCTHLGIVMGSVRRYCVRSGVGGTGLRALEWAGAPSPHRRTAVEHG